MKQKRLRNTVLHRSCVHRSKRNIIARTCYQFQIRFGNSKSGVERVERRYVTIIVRIIVATSGANWN